MFWRTSRVGNEQLRVSDSSISPYVASPLARLAIRLSLMTASRLTGPDNKIELALAQSKPMPVN